MILPSIEQVSQNINGVNVQCAHITCTAAACFRMENVLDTISSGSFTFQSVMKSNAAHKIIVAVGNVSATFDLTSSWVKYVSVYENVDPQAAGRDMIIFFPAGEYWLYHTMLEHGTKASDWKVSPEDTEEQIAQIYVEIREQYTQIMSDVERILLEAVSSRVKISDFETFKVDNNAAIELMADEIRQTVAETYETKNNAGTKYEQYEAEFAQHSREITLKVSATDYTAAKIAAMINEAGSSVIIEAEHVELAGNVVLKDNLTDGTTQISGNNIKTGTISADRIGTKSITVDKLSGQIKDSGNTWAIDLTNGTMTIGDISASNIKTGTMSADRIHGGSIDAGNVTINNLNASKITTGILDVNRIPNLSADKITTGSMSADRISGGSIDASNVTITNLNASNITSGTLAADKIAAGTISAAIEATNFTMKGGSIKITGTYGTSYIDLMSSNGFSYLEPGQIGVSDADLSVRIDKTSGLVLNRGNIEDVATITRDGYATFKRITATGRAYLPSNTYINGTGIDDYIADRSESSEISFSGTSISNGHAHWFTTKAGICILVFYFQASGAITSDSTITISSLPKNASAIDSYSPIAGYSITATNMVFGRALLSGKSNSIKIRTMGAGAFYGMIVYPV